MAGDEKRIDMTSLAMATVPMAAVAALVVGPHDADPRIVWRDSERPAYRVSKNLKHPAEPGKKAARKRQKKARAITRRKAR